MDNVHNCLPNDPSENLAHTNRSEAQILVQWNQAFLACRLIPLNKNPGVQPIGVGEVLRRIIGKAIMTVVNSDVLKATGAPLATRQDVKQRTMR